MSEKPLSADSGTNDARPADSGTKLPKWREVAGLTVENEGTMTRSERRYALRKLFRYYENLVREHLKEHEKDPEKDERTFLWDPVPTICFELGIARSKLSSLTKELTGMAAHEVVDKVRAEGIGKKMAYEWASLLKRKFVAGGDMPEEPRFAKCQSWDEILGIVVREAKREPAFEHARRAVRMGFPNYARFRRGVMLAYKGATPQVLEAMLLQDLAAYYGAAGELAVRRKIRLGKKDETDEELELPESQWATAMRERPEWLTRMVGMLGLAEELVPEAEAECAEEKEA